MSLPTPSSDSIAVVTGGSSGIGEQLARQLSARGHQVALVARREDCLTRLADELGGPGRAIPVCADLAEPEDRDMLAARLDELGVVEILVNNAGMGVHVAFVDADREDELKQLRVNVETVVDLMGRYLPGMVERGRGAVIQVASTVSFQPIPVQAVYAATKAFVRSFSEAVSAELKGTGVAVTALCPGPVATEFLEAGGFKNETPGPSFIWSTAEDVAKAGIEGVDKGKRVVVPGVVNRATAFFGQHGPHSVLLGPVANAYRRVIGE